MADLQWQKGLYDALGIDSKLNTVVFTQVYLPTDVDPYTYTNSWGAPDPQAIADACTNSILAKTTGDEATLNAKSAALVEYLTAHPFPADTDPEKVSVYNLVAPYLTNKNISWETRKTLLEQTVPQLATSDVSPETVAGIQNWIQTNIPSGANMTDPEKQGDPSLDPNAQAQNGQDTATTTETPATPANPLVDVAQALIENADDSKYSSGLLGISRGNRAKDIINSAEFSSASQQHMAEVLSLYIAHLDDADRGDSDKLNSSDQKLVLAIANETATPKQYAVMFNQDTSGDETRRGAISFYLENANDKDIATFLNEWEKLNPNGDRRNDVETCVEGIENPTKRALATYAQEYIKTHDDDVKYDDPDVFLNAFKGAENDTVYAFISSSAVTPQDGSKAIAKLPEKQIKDLLKSPPSNDAGEPDLGARNKMLAMTLLAADDSNAHKAALDFFHNNFFVQEGPDKGKLDIDATLGLLRDPTFSGNDAAQGSLKSLLKDDKIKEQLQEYIKGDAAPSDKLALATTLSENYDLIFNAFEGSQAKSDHEASPQKWDAKALGDFLKSVKDDPNVDGFIQELAARKDKGLDLNAVMIEAFGESEKNPGTPAVDYDYYKAHNFDKIPNLANVAVRQFGEEKTPEQAAKDAVLGDIANDIASVAPQPEPPKCIFAQLMEMFTNMFNPQQEVKKPTLEDLGIATDNDPSNNAKELQEFLADPKNKSVRDAVEAAREKAQAEGKTPEEVSAAEFDALIASVKERYHERDKQLYNQTAYEDSPYIGESTAHIRIPGSDREGGYKDEKIYFSALDVDGKPVNFDENPESMKINKVMTDVYEALADIGSDIVLGKPANDKEGQTKFEFTPDAIKDHLKKLLTATEGNTITITINGKAWTISKGDNGEPVIVAPSGMNSGDKSPEQMFAEEMTKVKIAEYTSQNPAFLPNIQMDVANDAGGKWISFNTAQSFTSSEHLQYLENNPYALGKLTGGVSFRDEGMNVFANAGIYGDDKNLDIKPIETPAKDKSSEDKGHPGQGGV